MSLDFWGIAAPLPVPTLRPAPPPAEHPNLNRCGVSPASWVEILDSPELPQPAPLPRRPRVRRTGRVALRTLLVCVTTAALAVDAYAATDVTPALLGLLAR